MLHLRLFLFIYVIFYSQCDLTTVEERSESTVESAETEKDSPLILLKQELNAEKQETPVSSAPSPILSQKKRPYKRKLDVQVSSPEPDTIIDVIGIDKEQAGTVAAGKEQVSYGK